MIALQQCKESLFKKNDGISTRTVSAVFSLALSHPPLTSLQSLELQKPTAPQEARFSKNCHYLT